MITIPRDDARVLADLADKVLFLKKGVEFTADYGVSRAELDRAAGRLFDAVYPEETVK